MARGFELSDATLDRAVFSGADGETGPRERLHARGPKAACKRQQLSDGRPLKSGGEGLLAGWGGQAAKARRGGIQTRSRRRRHSRQWTFQKIGRASCRERV